MLVRDQAGRRIGQTIADANILDLVAKGGLDLGKLEDEAEKQEAEKAADEYKDLLEKVKASLGDKVKDVRVTYRLTDSPSCLVSDEHDPSGNLARLMKAAGQPMPNSKPILEINPQHPAVMRLKYEESRFDGGSCRNWMCHRCRQLLLRTQATLKH